VLEWGPCGQVLPPTTRGRRAQASDAKGGPSVGGGSRAIGGGRTRGVGGRAADPASTPLASSLGRQDLADGVGTGPFSMFLWTLISAPAGDRKRDTCSRSTPTASRIAVFAFWLVGRKNKGAGLALHWLAPA